ncbi:MAG: type II toxin-antitoxin system VapC family toxin [Acidimicrobiia bacterium]
MIFLDTHVAIWLADGQTKRLSSKAVKSIDGSDSVSISPLVLLEMQFLVEAGRLTHPTDSITKALAIAGIGVHDGSLTEIATKAIELGWTRDPFDRLIAGHASAFRAALVTKDQTLLDNYSRAIW